MRVSRSTSVVVGLFALLLLGLGIALSVALNRIEQLEGSAPSANDVNSDLQRLREEVEMLREQLEIEMTKSVALEAALELARAEKRPDETPSLAADEPQSARDPESTSANPAPKNP